MGVTVRQKRPGKGEPWHVFIHQDGVIRSKRIGDKRAAEAVAAAVRKKLAVGEMRLGQEAQSEGKPMPTFGAFARQYLDGYAKVACKRNTWEGYEVIIARHLEPIWKDKRLDQITRADVKQLLYAKQQEGPAGEAALKPKTVENIKALISGIFTHAYEDELLSVNPALKLGRFIQKYDRRRALQPYNREQSAAFLAAAKRLSPGYYPLFLCAFRTGMRLGELVGLGWEDIDFEANTIEVKRAYSHNYFSTPKSGRSRTLDMSDQLKRVLLEHREALRVQFGGTLPTYAIPGKQKGQAAIQPVFCDERGEPFTGDHIRQQVFYAILEEADLPRVRFHDIRHTFASLLLQQGESLHYVKEQMGHASIQTTVDVYGHLVPGSNRNAVNRLDEPEDAALRLALAPVAG
jgi:integrase